MMRPQEVTEGCTSTWNIDPVHTVAEFKVRHMAISNVKGVFATVAGSLTLNAVELSQSHVEATIDATSIETRDAGRDTHLKSVDFLDTEKFPTLTFASTIVRQVRPGELTVEGELTIRDVTRTVAFDVEGPTPPEKDPWGNLRVAVSATTRISRKEFGLVWNTVLESGGILVGDEVAITLDVQFVRASS
jgi:polyisoprenoid-binding protein YceI